MCMQARADLAAGTKEVYRRELGTLVLPTFGDFRLREVTTGRVDSFLRPQSAISSAPAGHTRLVLNLLFSFALRRDVVTRNPVTAVASRLRCKWCRASVPWWAC